MNTANTPNAPRTLRITRAASAALLASVALAAVPPVAQAAPPTATTRITHSDEFYKPGPLAGMIGKDTEFTVHFDNTSDTVGFGPYVDLYMPSEGDDGDDGLTIKSANYLGAPLQPHSTFDCFGNTVKHPFTGLDVACPDESTLVIYELPFGSFAPDQPVAKIDITAGVSPNLLTGFENTITAVGGYRYGDSATGAAPIVGAPTSEIFTGNAIEFTKIYVGPEHETATGPNYPRTYRLVADIAEGFTVNNFQIKDALPDGMQFLAIDAAETTAGGTTTATPSTSTPGGQLTHTWNSLTGTAADVDAELVFSWYVPEYFADGSTPVLDPPSGDDRILRNDSSWAAASLVPGDADDPTQTSVSGNPNKSQDEVDRLPDDHELEAQSIAVQKTANDTTVRPGQNITFTVDTQISDFFSVKGVNYEDIVPDGLEVTSAPTTATVTVQGGAPQVVNLTTNIDTDSGCSKNGVQTFTLALPEDFELPGGKWNGADAGATTLTYSYETRVLDTYRCLGGGSNVSAADRLKNTLVVDSDILDTAGNITDAETDDTAESLIIEKPSVEKQVIGRNGADVTGEAQPPVYITGDEVTYRLGVTIPSGDLQDFRLRDYVPFPVFALDSLTLDVTCAADAMPAVHKACWSANDTFHNVTRERTDFTVDPANNSFQLDFGDVSNPTNNQVYLELLFTEDLKDKAFLDGLYLTNQVQIAYTNNFDEEFVIEAIDQIELRAPYLRLKKGVVSHDVSPASAPVYDGLVVTNPYYADPTTDCSAADPTLAGSDFDAQAPDADAKGFSAGDTVRHVVTLHNSGREPATNVVVSDLIPSEMSVPASGLKLCVKDGNGNPLVVSGTTGFFAGDGDNPGTITLSDPIPADGIVRISYVVSFDDDATPGAKQTETATIDNFSIPGRTANFAPLVSPADRSDPDTVEMGNLSMDKTLLSSSSTLTDGNDLAVGERGTYQVEVTLAEGTYHQAYLQDDMQPGRMKVVSVDSITLGANIEDLDGNTPTPGGDAGVLTVSDNQVWAYFGHLVNKGTDGALDADDKITMVYTVEIVNDATIQQGNTIENYASYHWSTGPAGQAPSGELLIDDRVRHVIHEPTLDITKTSSSATIEAGADIDYTITVTAQSGDDATDAPDVVVTDTLPASLDYKAGTWQSVPPAQSITVVGKTLTATYDKLAMGDSAVITYTATANANLTVPSNTTNAAKVTWESLETDDDALTTNQRNGSDGPGGLNDYVTSDDITLSSPGGTIGKDIASTSKAHTDGRALAVGETATYSLDVTLPAGSYATGFTVTDDIPAGHAFVGGTLAVDTSAFNGSLGAHTLTADPGVSGGDLSIVFDATTVTADSDPNNNTVTITYDAIVLDEAAVEDGTTLTNQAQLTIPGDDPVDSPQVTVNVVEPQLTIAKESDVIDVDPGDTVTYTVKVTNTGTATAFNTRIVDDVPADFDQDTIEAVSAECGLTASIDAGVITYTGGVVPAPGGECSVSYRATILASYDGSAEITNTATTTYTSIPGGGRTYDPEDSSATIGPEMRDLAVTKTDGITTMAAGESSTYTIEVTNQGVAESTNITVADTLPDHLTITGNGGDAACVYGGQSGNNVTWTIASLAAGASASCTLTVQLDSALPAGVSTLTNTVTVSDTGSPYADPTPDNNTATDTNDVTGVPDLVLAKEALSDVLPGESITYQLTVTNEGTRESTGVTITDPLNSHLTFTGCTMTGRPIQDACALSGGNVTGTFTSLPAGESAVMTITATVDADIMDYTNSVSNTAVVGDDGGNGVDPTPGDNTDSTTRPVVTAADLSVTKTDGVTVVEDGDTPTYTITVRNSGTAPATGVTVTDTLPAGMEFVSCSDDCTANGQTVTWTIASLARGTSRDVTLSVKVVESAAGAPDANGTKRLLNTVTVTDDGTHGTDPTPNNNRDTDEDTISGDPLVNLVLDKTTMSSPLVPGTRVNYRITVTNDGPASVADITLVDELDPRLSGASYTASLGTFTPSTGAWTGVNLDAGDAVTLNVSALLAPNATGTLDNTATVSPPTGVIETNPSDNTDTVSDPLQPEGRVTIDKALQGALIANELAVYVLTATNVGPSTVRNVTLADVLPVGLELVTAEGDGWTCASSTCTFTGEIAPGGSAAVTVTTIVTAEPGTSLSNEGRVTEISFPGIPDPIQIDNDADEDTTDEVDQPVIVGGGEVDTTPEPEEPVTSKKEPAPNSGGTIGDGTKTDDDAPPAPAPITRLPMTGTELGVLVGLATVLVSAGAFALVVVRRRKATS